MINKCRQTSGKANLTKPAQSNAGGKQEGPGYAELRSCRKRNLFSQRFELQHTGSNTNTPTLWHLTQTSTRGQSFLKELPAPHVWIQGQMRVPG